MEQRDFTFSGKYGESKVAPSADGEWTVCWNKLRLHYEGHAAAQAAGYQLAFNGKSPSKLRAVKVEVLS